MPTYAVDEPIAALATPPGRGAIGIIRVSGDGAIDRVAALSSVPAALRDAAGHTVHYGEIRDLESGEAVDEVLFLVFRAPRSYTGEDAVEIQGHGSPPVLDRILALLAGQGIRAAAPGEFTYRAFINGKLDLTQAEAVNELVNAQTTAAGGLALRRLSGAVYQRIDRAKERLVGVMANLAVQIDYPDDETGEIPMEVEAVREVRADLHDLRHSYATGRLYQEGALVVIAGRTNAGKSSLFNALLREDRAIVSETHGTTRDYLEVAVSMQGVPVRLIDTAGLRESDESIETEGIRRSRELLASADAAIYVVDGLTGVTEEDREEMRHLETTLPGAVIPVRSKSDLVVPSPESDDGDSSFAFSVPGAVLLPVSAVTGDGLSRLGAETVALLRRIRGAVAGSSVPTGTALPGAGEAVIDSARQRDLLDRAIRALDAAEEGMDATIPADAVAVDVQDAMGALGEITGEVSSADILDVMFGSFCLGK